MEISDSTLISVIYLAIGSLFLYLGAEGLVRGASSIALRFGIKPLVIGLTLVAYGTSSPEFAVSLSAALEGNSGISVGNVIGSNICNIALILGLSALIRPMEVHVKVIKTDISIMVGVTILSILLISDGAISFFEGIILTLGIIIYTVVTIYLAKKDGVSEEYQHFVDSRKKKYLDIIFLIFGLGGVLLGAHIFLIGAEGIAVKLGASEALIGLTIVALGTSLPELATSVVASYKNEGDISIGNVIGSNIFNLLGILGITAIIVPLDTNSISYADLGLMLVVAILIIPMAFTHKRLSRLEGVFLLIIYILYVAYLYITHFSGNV